MSDPQFYHIGDPFIGLIEECSELIHILCKSKRFGLDGCHQSRPAEGTVKERIFFEMEDVQKRIREVKEILENES